MIDEPKPSVHFEEFLRSQMKKLKYSDEQIEELIEESRRPIPNGSEIMGNYSFTRYKDRKPHGQG